MEYIVVVYKSRSHTVKFSELLKSNGVYNEIINTPKEANVGCGLSVKVGVNDFIAVKKIARYSALSSFADFLLVKINYGKRTVRSI